MKPERLTNLTPTDVAEINYLLHQLSTTSHDRTLAELERILAMDSSEVLVVRDKDHIVGMGMTIMIHKLKLSYAQLDDIIVNDEYRGQGLGRILLAALIARSRECGAEHIELTSNRSRVGAIKLYKQLGFVRRDTNLYRLD